MNGKRAKALRRAVYGDYPSSSEARRYGRLLTGQVVADGRRRLFQLAKKNPKRLEEELERQEAARLKAEGEARRDEALEPAEGP